MGGRWESLLAALEERRRAAAAMGGAAKLESRRAAGRLNARERVDRLCDAGTFVELGALVGSIGRAGLPAAPADALIGGVGEIDGRPVVVFAEDFTVQGGSIGLGNQAKRVRLAELALQERVPLVMLLEGAGERASNSLERYPRTPNDLQMLARLSGEVPTVGVVMGSSAGHGALCAVLADFLVMVDGAALFSAGPLLVKGALGEDVGKEELGGARMHASESGVAHGLAPDDEAALSAAREYLSFFPQSAGQPLPRRGSGEDIGRRRLEGILDVVPADVNRPYDVRRVIELLVDRGRSLEIQPEFGRAIETVLARIGGVPVAIVANQPAVAGGAIDRAAAEKATRFLEVAGVFALPVVFLTDNPGIMPGTRAERSGVLRAAARMYAAQARLRGPKIHVTLRKAFGFGSSIMAMNPFDGQTLSVAFPSATLGALPASSGAAAAKLDDEQRAGVAATQAEAWSHADSMAYDDVIDPRELRNVVIAGLALSRQRL